ncbi:MAG: phage baseplate assembly protein V [Actinomycetota bacterium]
MTLDANAVPLNLAQLLTAAGSHYFGVYPATVADNQDPDSQGRVPIRLPWSPDTGSGRFEVWARLATMMAGNNRGTWFIPEINDEVLVAFEGGDPSRPYVVGALWNGRDAPPQSMDADNNVRVMVSRSGIKITLDDTEGAVTLQLETPGGQTMTFADTPSSVVVQDANGNSCRMEAQGITVTAPAKVTVKAATAEVDAGMVTVNAGMSTFSGVVQCDVLIANTVVGAAYTPGAGNIW